MLDRAGQFGAGPGLGPVILSPNCTNCGRCIDVCSKDVFAFGARFNNRSAPGAGSKLPATRATATPVQLS